MDKSYNVNYISITILEKKINSREVEGVGVKKIFRSESVKQIK